MTEAAPDAEVVGDGEADTLLAVGWGLAVVEHDEGRAEGAGLVADDGAFVERGVLEIAGVGLGGGEDGILRQAVPLPESGGIVGVGEADGKRVGLVALLSAADVGEPVAALVGAELVGGVVPAGIVKGEAAVGLPGVPALLGEGQDFPEALPVEEIVGYGEVGLVADFVLVYHEHHEPTAVVAENVGAIEHLARAGGEDDSVFEGGFHLLVQLAHELAGDQARFAGAWERDDGGALRGIKAVAERAHEQAKRGKQAARAAQAGRVHAAGGAAR